MSDKKNIANLILDSKTRKPEYQRLDVEPKQAGQSLLHDEFGMSKAGPTSKRSIPVMKEITNKPISVKATEKSDDGFLPPKSNFISVGNVDHSWYDSQVTGIIDNNDEIDVDSIQGINPLQDKSDKKLSKDIYILKKKLEHVKTLVTSELSEITEVDELQNLRKNTFGKSGVFNSVLNQFGTIPEKQKVFVGELINDVYSEVDLEIKGKEFELTKEAEEDAEDDVTEWPEDMAQMELPYQTDNSYEDDIEDKGTHSFELYDFPTIQEGSYVIIVDNKMKAQVSDINSVRTLISELLLSENIDFSRIQLIKRINVDFGIIIDE